MPRNDNQRAGQPAAEQPTPAADAVPTATAPIEGGDPVPEPIDEEERVRSLAIALAVSQGYPHPTQGDLACGRPISYITMAEMFLAAAKHLMDRAEEEGEFNDAQG
jgi:hypothetical protein